MRKDIVSGLLCFFTLSILSLHGQWVKTLGSEKKDNCRAIIRTLDRGIILAGTSEPYTQFDNRSIWITKVTEMGEIEWLQNWEKEGQLVSGHRVSVQAMAESSLGTYAVVGHYGRFLYHLFVMHLDAGGELLWKRMFLKGSRSLGMCIESTLDGGFLVGGRTSIASRANDAWILRLDSAGNVLWDTVFGGEHDDEISFVQSVEDGGYMLLGTTHSFGAGLSDVWLVRLDQYGDILWQKTYGTPGIDKGYHVTKIEEDFVIAGEISSEEFGNEAWIFRIKPKGVIKWQKRFNAGSQSEARYIVKADEGGFGVAGTLIGDIESDMLIFKISSSGSVEWSRMLGSEGNETAHLLSTAEEGRYFVVGDTDRLGADPANVLLMKFSPIEGVNDCVFYGDIELFSFDSTVVPAESQAQFYHEQTFIEEPELIYGGLMKIESICPYTSRKGTRPIR